MSWDEVYGAINEMINEAYEMGQRDIRQKVIARMDAVAPNDTYSRAEVIEYLGGKEE